MTESHRGSALPAGWAVSALDDVADLQLGKMLDRARRTRGQVLPYLRNANVRWGTFDLSDLLEIPFEENEVERFSLRPGDVVICEGGEPGRSAVWTQSNSPIKFQKALHRVRLHGGIEPRWLMFHLMRDATTGVLAQRFTGTTIKHLPREALQQYLVRLAPLREQREVVAAIDSYFTRLDDAVASLKRVQSNLKRYRSSVLKAAVEGRLVPTEAELARNEGRDYEPASILLARILADRRRGWEAAELAKMKATGKAPNDDRWKKKYKEPVAPNTTDFLKLPDGWCWATLEQLSEFVTDGDHNPPKRVASGIPHLTAKNVKQGSLILNGCSFVDDEGFRRTRSRYDPKPGDVIVTCVGTLGEAAVVPEGIVFSADRNLAAARPVAEGIEAAFLLYALNSPHLQKIMREASGATAQPHLYLSDLRALPVPLPPKKEQRRVVAKLDRQLSVLRAVEGEVEGGQERAQNLRSAILRRTFDGRLVDQDPNDESASVLLERIRAERAAIKPNAKNRAGRGKVDAA